MVVGEIAEHADLVVLGGGPGGYTAALHAAALGREVTLVERGGPEALGGACLHVGCIPSKALIELADALQRTRELPGLAVDGAHADLRRFQAAREETTARLARGVAGLLEGAGVRVLTGEARFARADRLAVRTPEDHVRFLEFGHAVLATGSRPLPLEGLPFDGERVLDSTGALALTAVPDTVAVVGGGYIGVELGTALAKLGSRVTLLEARDRLLGHLDPALVRPVAERLAALGVAVRTGVPDAAAAASDADVVVVAVGRRPNTDELGLDRARLATSPAGHVEVDAVRRASEAVAAIGDVVAGPALAHRAAAEARVAVDALCGLPADPDPLLVPEVVFSDPEIASVGLTESRARAAGLDAATGSVPLSASGRAATLGRRDGAVRVVVDRGTDRVVGVHLVGPHASELVAEGALAVELLAAPHDLGATIHPHPTISEALSDAARALAKAQEAV